MKMYIFHNWWSCECNGLNIYFPKVHILKFIPQDDNMTRCELWDINRANNTLVENTPDSYLILWLSDDRPHKGSIASQQWWQYHKGWHWQAPDANKFVLGFPASRPVWCGGLLLTSLFSQWDYSVSSGGDQDYIR